MMRERFDWFGIGLLLVVVMVVLMLLTLSRREDAMKERERQMLVNAFENAIEAHERQIEYLKIKLHECEEAAARPDSVYYMEGSGW
jgi:hypothetical protein